MASKILVVDDEEDMVTVLLARLGEHGYETASASNGEQALGMILKEKFDLIILDILMPVMSGTELAQILKDNPDTQNIPVIFLTALGIRRKDIGYRLSGSGIVFTKPFDSAELISKIDELLAAPTRRHRKSSGA